MYELKPIDSRKSFYGKAVVTRDGDTLTLTSYTTKVATYNEATKELKVNGWYSNTTARHIRSFLDFCGLPNMTKQEMEAGHYITK